jgi:hypothetical protein
MLAPIQIESENALESKGFNVEALPPQLLLHFHTKVEYLEHSTWAYAHCLPTFV